MDERELRSAFQRLREEELAKIPPFRSAAAEPPLSKRRWRAALRNAALVTAVLIIAIVSLHHRPTTTTDSILTWKPQTDFLLRTPGSELLSTVPQIPERK